MFIDLSGGIPEFFILIGDHARELIGRRHEQWLKSVGDVRPRTPGSKHSGVGKDPWRRGGTTGSCSTSTP